MITYELPLNVFYHIVVWENFYDSFKWEELNFNWQG